MRHDHRLALDQAPASHQAKPQRRFLSVDDIRPPPLPYAPYRPLLWVSKRGDVVIVVAAGDHGKPRPAVIVRTDAFPEAHALVVVCQMTSEIVDAPDFRVTIDPNEENGLRVQSQVVVDKPVAVRRERVGQFIGRLSGEEIGRLNIALAFVMGLAD